MLIIVHALVIALVTSPAHSSLLTTAASWKKSDRSLVFNEKKFMMATAFVEAYSIVQCFMARVLVALRLRDTVIGW